MFTKPKKLIAFLLSVVITFSIITPAFASPNTSANQTTTVTTFTDLTGQEKFDTAILWAAQNGITTGWSDGSFRPWNTCNRAAIITFLWRMEGKEPATANAKFSDLTGNTDFDKAISWGAEQQITTGWSDNTFRPWNYCNRAAIITFLWRLDGKPTPQKMASFKDMTGNSDFDKAISWAAENGITTGWADNTFRPWNYCTRAAVVAFLYRYDDYRTDPESGSPESPIYVDFSSKHQSYLGGYIEIQPDSWGSITSHSEWSSPDIVTGDIVEDPEHDRTAWGFPYAFSDDTMNAIKSDVLSGDGTGIMYIRFPLGFAYRGYRNIDEETGLAKNIGERWPGQNDSIKELCSDIEAAGGGLAPEYWCPAPYWLTGDPETNISLYSGATDDVNQLWAGGDYPRDVSLASIKESDPEQYETQIDEFTDAIIDDLEYLENYVAEVKQFGLQNEPNLAANTKYGHCDYDAQTYNDVLEVLVPKIKNTPDLSDIKINVSSEFTSKTTLSYSIASTYIRNHPEDIDLYSWRISVRNQATYHKNGTYTENNKNYFGANIFKTDYFKQLHALAGNNPMFISEFEYMDVADLNTEEKQAKACSNNMLRMVYELTYANAQMLHPIIHLAKPVGQIFDNMTYIGYSMFNIDMDDGSYSPNNWSYHSWKLFSDNLPIDAVMVGDYTEEINDIGWVTFRKGDQTYLFMVNGSDEEKSLTLSFPNSKYFEGYLYNLDECGTIIGKERGKTITFDIPANSGIYWEEL